MFLTENHECKLKEWCKNDVFPPPAIQTLSVGRTKAAARCLKAICRFCRISRSRYLNFFSGSRSTERQGASPPRPGGAYRPITMRERQPITAREGGRRRNCPGLLRNNGGKHCARIGTRGGRLGFVCVHSNGSNPLCRQTVWNVGEEAQFFKPVTMD